MSAPAIENGLAKVLDDLRATAGECDEDLRAIGEKISALQAARDAVCLKVSGLRKAIAALEKVGTPNARRGQIGIDTSPLTPLPGRGGEGNQTRGEHRTPNTKDRLVTQFDWRSVDWSQRDMDIAAKLGCTPTAVYYRRKKLSDLKTPGRTFSPHGSGEVPSQVPPLPSGLRPPVKETSPASGIDTSPLTPLPGRGGEGNETNVNLTPTSEGGVRIGLSLREPFTSTDLESRLDGERARCHQWIAQWKGKGWIETVGFGSYKRSRKFGKFGNAPASGIDTSPLTPLPGRGGEGNQTPKPKT